MNSFSYSIAIRTLGKGGEKYKQELESICHQSIQPDKVIVYILKSARKINNANFNSKSIC